MEQVLGDPIVRRELGVALSNAAIGVLLAALVGMPPSLWWLGVLAAVVAFGFAALSDRRDVGLLPSAALAGAFVAVLIGLWALGQPLLGAVALVVIGTSVGFGANRVVFGVVEPVPERRREREWNQNEA